MKFSINQQDLQKSLNYCQGVIEKRNTLPILSNILLEANDSKLKTRDKELSNNIDNLKNQILYNKQNEV